MADEDVELADAEDAGTAYCSVLPGGDLCGVGVMTLMLAFAAGCVVALLVAVGARTFPDLRSTGNWASDIGQGFELILWLAGFFAVLLVAAIGVIVYLLVTR